MEETMSVQYPGVEAKTNKNRELFMEKLKELMENVQMIKKDIEDQGKIGKAKMNFEIETCIENLEANTEVCEKIGKAKMNFEIETYIENLEVNTEVCEKMIESIKVDLEIWQVINRLTKAIEDEKLIKHEIEQHIKEPKEDIENREKRIEYHEKTTENYKKHFKDLLEQSLNLYIKSLGKDVEKYE
jgi:hypothetical protein